jgi:hypothetical protein
MFMCAKLFQLEAGSCICSVNYEHGLRVFCTWKSVWMFLASPWASDSHEVCVNTPLRIGVERVNASQANDYIYDNRLGYEESQEAAISKTRTGCAQTVGHAPRGAVSP